MSAKAYPPKLVRDGGRPSGSAMQVEASKHRKMPWEKAMVVIVTEKVKQDFISDNGISSSDHFREVAKMVTSPSS